MNHKYLFRYSLAGVLFGMIFPILSTILQTLQYDLTLTLENLAHVQAEARLLWIIDTAPFFLGVFAGLAGIRQDRLNQQNKNLETEVLFRNQAFEELEKLKNIHDQEVKERTLILEREVLQSKASTQVTQAVSSILNPDELINQVVTLIQEAFDLYYVGIFTPDDLGQWAILRTGTGEAGQAMLSRGHRIKIGEGMIGWSIANAQARIAAEVGEDAVRLATDELPNTRSEAAIPLRSRGQVLGAITVQDTKTGVFNDRLVSVLQTMADQVAVGLDNAQLFSQAELALEAERQAYGKLGQEAWMNLLRDRPEKGFRFAKQSISPANDDWCIEMTQAIKSGQTVIGNDKPSIAIPLRVRDQIIGVLNFSKGDPIEKWTDREVTLLETLTEEMGQALETARLYEETQIQANNERMIGEVTSRMRESLDINNVLQTAAREFRSTLDLAEVEILMGSNPTKENE